MTGPFLINDARIRELSATRQGRVSIGGFTYQASYAAARLACFAEAGQVGDDHPPTLVHGQQLHAQVLPAAPLDCL
jgi:hypothetical protein